MAMRNAAKIDLTVLRKNALTVKARANTRLCAVVKADAYGHGAAEVANALSDVADCFAVSLYEEALTLRYAGITKDILMLTPPLSAWEAADCAALDVTLCIDGLAAAKRAKEGARRAKKPVSAHIAVDSGMHRLGAREEELDELLSFLKKASGVAVRGAYSHFADTGDLAYCKKQLAYFLSAGERCKRVFPDLLLHIGATGSLNLPISASLDMVRVGLGLYGYGTEGVSPVMRLSAPVLRYGTLHHGEHLGYGNAKTGTAKYAVCRFGYADGPLRSTGQLTPRCMDLSFVPQSQLKEKHTVLLGTRTAEDAAKEEGTISYEILCRYASRAKKEYLR